MFMSRFWKTALRTLLTLALSLPLWAGDAAPASGSAPAAGNNSLNSSTIRAEGNASLNSGLVGLLVNKGLITSTEANDLLSGPASEVTGNLLKLLKAKGLVSDADLANLGGAPAAAMPAEPAASAVLATPHVSAAQAATSSSPTANPPTTIPAVAPLRVLPIDVPKQAGMIPDIKLGSGANIKLYGFYKAFQRRSDFRL